LGCKKNTPSVFLIKKGVFLPIKIKKMIAEYVLTSVEEVLERLKSGEIYVEFEGTFDLYADLLAHKELRPQLFKNEIFCTMSYATTNHEILVSNIITELNIVYKRTDCRVLGSNRPLFVPKCDAWFEADASLLCGDEQSHKLKGTMTAVLNPKIIVEIHSDSTRDHDYGRKLNCYKQMPSVQQIIYIESVGKPHVSLFTRTNKPNEWLNNDFDALHEAFPVNGGFVAMADLYDKIVF
jgi:Uma2 family endonuclease